MKTSEKLRSEMRQRYWDSPHVLILLDDLDTREVQLAVATEVLQKVADDLCSESEWLMERIEADEKCARDALTKIAELESK